MRAAAPAAGINLAQHRQVHNAHGHVAIRFERDQIRPQRIAAYIISRSINGVDDPTAAAARIGAGAFLAHDSIVWKRIAEHACDHSLAFAVGLRHGRFIGLGFGDDIGLVSQREVGSYLRGCDGSIQFFRPQNTP